MKPELPILAKTIDTLERLEKNPRLSAKDLEHVLCLDPALAIRVLHHAIHMPRRRMENPITTLLQAAMMAGIGPVKALAHEAPVAEAVFTSSHLPHYKMALAQAALSGRFGLYIAQERRELEPGEIAMAALFATLGELSLWKVAPAEMHEFECLRQQPGVHPQEAAYVVFGTSIGDLTHTLAVAWDLPALLREALDPHQPLSARGIGPLLASRLAWHALRDWNNALAESDLRACARHLDMDINALVHDFEEIISGFEAEAAAYYDLPSLPSLGETLVAHPALPPAPYFCQAPDPAWLKLGEQRLLRASSQKDLLNALLESCYGGLGMNRAVLGRRHQDADQRVRLEAEAMIGADYDYKLHRFSMEVKDKDLFGLLMRKPAAVWLRGEQTPQFSKLLPSEVLKATEADHFFCASLFVGDVPFGVVYADRRHRDCALTASCFAAFKRLITFTNHRLAKLTETGA